MKNGLFAKITVLKIMTTGENNVKKNHLFGNLLLIFTAVIWGTAFAFQRVGMESIEPFTFGASRMTLAAIAIGIFSLFCKDEKFNDIKLNKAYKKNTIIGGICCGVFLTMASMLQQTGIIYTTAGKAGFITALYIIIVPVINFVVFKKKSSLLVLVSVIIGLIGMYLLCINEGFFLSYGDTLVLICAFFFSGHILCCDYFVLKGNPIRISAIQFTTVAVISWIFAFVFETPGTDKIISAALPIVYCGVISGGLGYTFQIVAQKYTEPTVASLLMSLESVFAVIAGAIILNERMTERELIGCIIMFIAIIIVQIPEKNKN